MQPNRIASILIALLTFAGFAPAQDHAPLSEAASASEVARLRVQVPDRATFQAWGTLPLPAGTPATAWSPLTILDQSGAPRVTQAEPVRWHADGTVAVVELAATIERGELEPGSWAEFAVVAHAQPWGGVPRVAPSSAALAMIKGRAQIRATDLEGKVYVAELGGSLFAPTARVIRWGPAKATARQHAWLAAQHPTAGPPTARLYPFAGSATAYWTAVDGSDVLELDLQFANAASVPLETLWLESLELILPAAFNAASYAPDPFFGPARVEAGRTVVPLARVQADGELHAIRWGQRHAWRLAVHPRGAELEAAEILSRRGWGLAVDGENAAGERLLSWAAGGTLPQDLPAPDLATLPGVGEFYRQRWEAARSALEGGTTLDFAAGTAPRLGAFFHSYGSPYGGMTGGGHIWPTAATQYAWADRRAGHGPQPEAVLYLQALAGMRLDRQRGILMRGDGLPLPAAALFPADESERPAWRRHRSPGIPTWNEKVWPAMKAGRDFDWIQGDPFGQDSLATPATELAFESGRVPEWYWSSAADRPGSIWSWASIDAQHGIRWLWPMQTLVELTNDPLAREWIQGEAQVARLERHRYQESHLFGLMQDAAARPGIGSSHAGRGDAHTMNLWAYAYSLARPSSRSAWLDELRDVVDAALDVQTPFGVWAVSEAGKVVTQPPMTGEHRVAQSIESSFMAHALLGLRGAAFAGVDPARAARIDAALVRHAVGVVSWGWQGTGNYFRAAVGPLDGSALFLDGPPLVDGRDSTTILDPLTYGLRAAAPEDADTILAGIRQLLGVLPDASIEAVATRAVGTSLSSLPARAGAVGILQELAQ